VTPTVTRDPDEELSAKGLGLATISYDRVEPIAAFAKQHNITFPMLSDAGSVTIKRFGILNPVAEWAVGPDKDDPAVQEEVRKYVSVVGVRDFMVGIAFPGTFILDTVAPGVPDDSSCARRPAGISRAFPAGFTTSASSRL